jgi:hypothetical protein
MSSQEEVARLIGGLPGEVGVPLLTEFFREVLRFDSWSGNAKAFGEEIGDPQPGDPSFGHALLQWSNSKSDGIVDRMVERTMSLLESHYGQVPVSREEVRDYVKGLRDSKMKG